MRKWILLTAYCNQNLGDDLIIKILLERYPDYCFFYENWYNESEASEFCKYENFYNIKKYEKNVFRKQGNNSIIRRLQRIILERLIKRIRTKSIASVQVGGSMFIQRDDSVARKRRYLLDYGPMFIIGANFGPYYSEDYVDGYKEFFKRCKSVVFRDKFSYQLFSELPNVEYASDVVFALEDTKRLDKPRNIVLVSVIDLSGRTELQQYKEVYESTIRSICVDWTKKGKKVILVSLCKNEGDEECINRVHESLNFETRELVGKHFYRGNIKRTLQLFEEAECVIATRFHAMILAMQYDIPFFVFSYSPKIENVLDDFGIKSYCRISSLSDSILEQIPIKMISLDFEKKKQMFINPFQRLDEFLDN